MRPTGDLQKDIKKKKSFSVLDNLTAERAKNNKGGEVWPAVKRRDSLVLQGEYSA